MIGAVAVAAVWLIGQLLVLVLPLVVALLLTRVLMGPSNWLRSHGWPRSVAALTALLAFGVVVGGLSALAAPIVGGELSTVGPAVTDGIGEVEGWIVDRAPGSITRADLESYRSAAFSQARDRLSRNGMLTEAVTLAVEVPAGLVLAVVLTFFFVRDGQDFLDSGTRRLPERHRPRAAAMGRSAWETLGGYLRGAALLGAVEAAIMGGVLALVGSDLVVPVMALTFIGAFVPFVGAIVAGVVAVLIALVSVGPTGALIVGITAIVVQQFDGDLLAPFVYGRSLRIHPVVVLVSVVAGGALFGFIGAVLAVPAVSVAINAGAAARDLDEAGRGGDAMSPTCVPVDDAVP